MMAVNFGLSDNEILEITGILKRVPKFDILNFHSIQEPALVEHIMRVGVIIYEKLAISN